MKCSGCHLVNALADNIVNNIKDKDEVFMINLLCSNDHFQLLLYFQVNIFDVRRFRFLLYALAR